MLAGGGGDLVLVDVGDGGVVLGQDGKDQRRGARGEVIEGVEGEWAEDEGKEEWRDEGSEHKGCEDEGLRVFISCLWRGIRRSRDMYGIFTRTPESFYHSHVVQGHGGEQNFSGIEIAELVEQDAPSLVVSP